MKSFRSACLLVSVALSAGVVASDGVDPSDFKSPAAQKAAETYSGALARFTKEYKERCDTARKACITQLTNAQAAATKAGNLDEALHIRDAISKLENEIQDSSPTVGRPTFATEREKLADALAGSVWQTGENRIRFNSDGSGVYILGGKPDSSKPPFAWVAITGDEIIVRYSSGWTNRMFFGDGMKEFVLHDPASGKKMDVPGGKRIQ